MLRRISDYYIMVTTDWIRVKAQLKPSQAITRFYVYGLIWWQRVTFKLHLICCETDIEAIHDKHNPFWTIVKFHEKASFQRTITFLL